MSGFSGALAVQIQYLLQSLNGLNSDAVFEDLCEYVGYGTEGSILVLQTCLDYLNIYEEGLKNEPFDPVFSSIFKHILDKPNFSTILCQSLRDKVISEDFLENLSKALGLSTSEKIGVGLALSDLGNADLQECGKNFCVQQIGELCADNLSLGSAEQMQSIFMFLQQSEGLSIHLNLFIQMLSLVPLKGDEEFILAPMVSRGFPNGRNLDLFNEDHEADFDALLAEMEKEMSMADIIKELGYGCTVSVSQCKEMLSLFLPLTEVSVARILGTIICTNTGLDDQQNTFSTFYCALGGTTSSDQPVLNSWNIDVLIDSIKQLAPSVSWSAVIENLDHEGFYMPNEAAFPFFMSVYRCACQDPFPLHAVCGSLWRNTEGQLSFLKYAVVAPHEVFTFAHCERQLAYADVVQGHKLHPGPTSNAWICLDLIQTLCQLAEVGHADAVRLMLPLEQCPEVLLLGMSHINTAYNLIQNEVSSTVLPTILNHSAGVGMVLYLWHINPSILLRGFVDAHSINPENISRIFEICQELKILSPVLDMVPSFFGIRLAALASHKDLVDMEKWLRSNLTTYQDSFYEECKRFTDQLGSSEDASDGHPRLSVSLCNLYSGTAPIVYKVLQEHTGLIVTDLLTEEMEKQLMSSTHASSHMKNTAPSDLSTSDGPVKDFEAEANSYFQQMFSGQITIDAMIQMLVQFKESHEKREKSIFDCMIEGLFEEHKFFSKYPERQLQIVAVFFGSLIKHQLVSHVALGIALRAVLDALRKPADSKMFVFGTKALEQFVDRLIEWPQYCNHILHISHLRATHSELVAFIERALARISAADADLGGLNANEQHGSFHSIAANVEMPSSSLSSVGSASAQPGLQISSTLQLQQQDQIPLNESQELSLASSNDMALVLPMVQPSPVPSTDASTRKNAATASTVVPSSSVEFVRPSGASTSAKFGSALNIETLVAAAERRGTPLEVPALEIQDKISFIINNLSAANIELKAKEFTEILLDQYHPWIAQYLVMKRASIEPNFHDLYVKFLDKVSSRSLYRETLQATYENCKVLLGSELIKSSSEERSLLKNLGSWLGKMTVGCNKYISAREIDPKSLIIEAYEKGLMIAVIPFTSKILESCKHSIAYRPPNRWPMIILELFAEIYAMPNLKMNLKFDIEVIFKSLGVDMERVSPTSLLKDIVRQTEGNPDFSTKNVGASSEIKSSRASALNRVKLPLKVKPAHPSGHSLKQSQSTAPPTHLTAGAPKEREKMAALNVSDELSSVQGLLKQKSTVPVNQLSVPASIVEQIIVNPKLHAHGLYLHFKSAIPSAMEIAIKEIVSSVVHNSVSIAIQTTKELVLKDYAMEYDESVIRNAAHLMVSSLAGSLAHVTCKEPLRSSIPCKLRNTLKGLGIGEELLEKAVQLVTNDNIDLGCLLIEKAATEKAVQNIDGEIAQYLAIIRKHREGVVPPFYDPSLYTQQRHAGVLHESLHSKPDCLSSSLQRVYEDFLKLPWQNQSSDNSSTLPVGSSQPSGSTVSGQLYTEDYPSDFINSCISSLTQSLDLTSEEMKSSAAQLHSSADGGVIQRNFDDELHTVETSSIVKESGSSLQTSLSTTVSDLVESRSSEPLLTTEDVLEKYQTISEKFDDMVAKEEDAQVLIDEISGVILRCESRDDAALAVAQKAFKGVYESASNSSLVSVHISVLAAIRDVSKLAVKELTNWVICSDEDRKFDKSITMGLIHDELLNLAEYNIHMAKLLDAGRNKAATEFTISLIQSLVYNNPRVIAELPDIVDALGNITTIPESPESLPQLVKVARDISAFIKEINARRTQRDEKAEMHNAASSREDNSNTEVHNAASSREDNSNTESDEPDPAGFRDKVSLLFTEWYKICKVSAVNDSTCARYVSGLHKSGLLKGDDMSQRFFRCLTEISVSRCLASETASETTSSVTLQSSQVQPLSFLSIDIYARLVFNSLKFFPVDQGSSKLHLLLKILELTVCLIQKDAEEKKTSFNPRPYFRLFINWIQDLGSMDPQIDGANPQVLSALANAFHAIQPIKVPGFSYAWLELISHKSFMPKLLTGNGQKGWPFMHRLLLDLLQFLEPYIRRIPSADIAEPVRFLYKGCLRVLLVLLHDFPDFLCDFHFGFCDVIPASCIQLRNIILSAFPRCMRLPDPSSPNLKIDLLPESSQPPRILSEVDFTLRETQMKGGVDAYLKSRQQGQLLVTELHQKLLLSPSESVLAGTRYNVPLMNSLILYIGMQAIEQFHAKSETSIPTITSLPVFLAGAALDIFKMMINVLDTEGRYVLLNVMANQLRYPNNHTYYFSFLLLYLFLDTKEELLQEQITRVVIERLVVNRPHPWGLLITFIELVKNPRYNFWSKSFIRRDPGVEDLFESVCRSFGIPKPRQPSVDDS